MFGNLRFEKGGGGGGAPGLVCPFRARSMRFVGPRALSSATLVEAFGLDRADGDGARTSLSLTLTEAGFGARRETSSPQPEGEGTTGHRERYGWYGVTRR